jgi:hypothetical protein
MSSDQGTHDGTLPAVALPSSDPTAAGFVRSGPILGGALICKLCGSVVAEQLWQAHRDRCRH